MVTRATNRAITDITQILVGKGYSDAQVLGADNLKEWAIQLGVYYSLLNTGAGAEFDPSFVDRFDVTKELRELAVLRVGGRTVGPESSPGSEVGGIGYDAVVPGRDPAGRPGEGVVLVTAVLAITDLAAVPSGLAAAVAGSAGGANTVFVAPADPADPAAPIPWTVGRRAVVGRGDRGRATCVAIGRGRWSASEVRPEGRRRRGQPG